MLLDGKDYHYLCSNYPLHRGITKTELSIFDLGPVHYQCQGCQDITVEQPTI